MKLEDFQKAQMDEILEWAGELDTILTPDTVRPARLKDFPLAMETSERLKRICKWRAAQVREAMQRIEDEEMDSIEQQEYVFKFNGGGQPVLKKKYPSADKRERELRRRLAEDECHLRLGAEYQAWDMMFSDWVSHVNRLRREMRLLEAEYMATGSDAWEQEAAKPELDLC